jgi:hypothetical protein
MLRRGFYLLALPIILVWLAPSPGAQAQCPSICDSNGNTALGDAAFNSPSTGELNTAIGYVALASNTTGNNNTANGSNTLFFNTTGNNNTANGAQALQHNTDGSYNTATGYQALFINNSSYNTATGAQALYSNTIGYGNTANGVQALYSNTTGYDNTANGEQPLFHNTTGYDNTADGVSALQNNTTGHDNTANGLDALLSNTTGINNTANGVFALYSNTTGDFNTAVGYFALVSNTTKIAGHNIIPSAGHDNTALGFQTLLKNTTGSSNIALGSNAGSNLTIGSNNIDIGALGTAGESNTIRIGKSGTQKATFIAGISGETVASGVGVIIDSNGQLGTVQSSARFKEAIKPMDKASEAILALRPVTFRYKEELDPDKIPQFGLVAEDVEKVNPDLVVRDEEGKVMTVRYDAVNAMLLNEFLKEHRKVADLEKKAVEQDSLKATIAAQQKQIEALIAGLQKVTARVELDQSASRVVSD